MYHGLKLIKERGIHDLVQVESNSALVVQIANSDCACDHQGESGIAAPDLTLAYVLEGFHVDILIQLDNMHPPTPTTEGSDAMQLFNPRSFHAAHIKWTSIRQEASSTYELTKTDAGPLTRNLLLEPRATINVQSNLHIVVDDVKCSHGAAISDLEESKLLYFQVCGIDIETARRVLVFAFGSEVIDKFPYSSIRDRVYSQIHNLLDPSSN
ncbi:hypothetical protein GYH30_010239 [Glycine max]|uniref:SUF system FeS cluster assembly SufBD core domain-containing protein n=1 Tax=Glycine max TaxID=3847 RepID=A0A0R0KGF0_SOYBN|nr:hypothetical protein GYH30_010239 [Glycine max]